MRRRRASLPEIKFLDPEERWDHSKEDEYLWWPRIQWIDPGGVSGVAVVWFDPKAVFEDRPMAKCVLAYSEMFLYGPEAGLNGQVNRYLRMRRTLDQEPGLATGVESFVPMQLNMSQDFLAPVRIRSALEFALSRTKPHGSETLGDGVPLYAQSPSDAITSFTNDRLKTLRMYTPGPDHVNDAKRHCLLWIRKLKFKGIEFFKQSHGDEEGWWS